MTDIAINHSLPLILKQHTAKSKHQWTLATGWSSVSQLVMYSKWCHFSLLSLLSRAPFGVGATRGSCLSSPVGSGGGGGGGSGCSQVGSKISDPSSPGSPGPSSTRPSTPLVTSSNSVSPASSPQTAAAQLKNCLRSSQHMVNQARTSMQLGKQKHTYTCAPL